jgi:hypothetical protein
MVTVEDCNTIGVAELLLKTHRVIIFGTAWCLT